MTELGRLNAAVAAAAAVSLSSPFPFPRNRETRLPLSFRRSLSSNFELLLRRRMMRDERGESDRTFR